MNQFVKSHGLGNDYVVLDGEKLSFQLTRSSIELLCSRNYGIGSDGILLLTRSEEADFGLRILNPDGSEAQKSGNGIRILAKFLYEHGYTDKEIFTIDTPGGRVEAALEVSGGKVKFVTVEMGKATFNSKLIPVTGAEREVVGEEITVDGDVMIFTGVSVGNPHCVVFIEVLDEGRLRKMAPLLETHRLFPERINVQFAKVRTTRRVEILIWERGAGYTLASGSSSCAVAAACVKNGLTDKSLTVSMPGGELDIEVREDWSIKMRGPVEEVMGGVISDELLEKL